MHIQLRVSMLIYLNKCFFDFEAKRGSRPLAYYIHNYTEIIIRNIRIPDTVETVCS